jgi:long-chain fatty acid transport protein
MDNWRTDSQFYHLLLGGGIMKRGLALLLIVILGVSSGLFASGVDLTGIGSRATALGGNYRGVSNTWDGLFWNPAGLVFSKGRHAGVGVEMIRPVVGYSPKIALNGQTFSSMSASNTENIVKNYYMPSLGFYSSNEKVAWGIGFFPIFGLGAKWALTDNSKYNAAYPQYDYEDDLKVLALQPTIAVKLSSKLSVGVGVDLVYADIMIRKPNFTPNPYQFDATLAANATIRTTLGTDAYLPQYNHLMTNTILEGDGMGFGTNVGLQFKLAPTLTVGASLRYYQDVALEGKASGIMIFANNAVVNQKVKALDAALFKPMLQAGKLSAQSYYVLTQFYSGRVDSSSLGVNKEIKADLPLPMCAGVGFAWTGIKNLLVTADVAMTQWSSWDAILINDTSGKKYSELLLDWEDTMRYGIGLEYSLAVIKLRGAFYSEPNAAIAATMQPTIPDVNRRNTIIAGVEIPLGPMRLHASYERMMISDATVDGWVLNSTKTGYENMAGTYKMSVNNALVGIDFDF